MCSNAVPLTLEALVEDTLPDLNTGVNRTSHNAWHNIYYIGKLGNWSSFARTVREAKLMIGHDSTILGYTMVTPRIYNIHNEQLICGDEASIQARFQHHVGHIMTAVYQCLDIEAKFSDAAACSEDLGGIPDIVCLESFGKVLLVGEVKTWWNHDLTKAYMDTMFLRKALGN